MNLTSRRLSVIALALGAFAVAGCGSDDNGADPAKSSTPSTSQVARYAAPDIPNASPPKPVVYTPSGGSEDGNSGGGGGGDEKKKSDPCAKVRAVGAHSPSC